MDSDTLKGLQDVFLPDCHSGVLAVLHADSALCLLRRNISETHVSLSDFYAANLPVRACGQQLKPTEHRNVNFTFIEQLAIHWPWPNCVS